MYQQNPPPQNNMVIGQPMAPQDYNKPMYGNPAYNTPYQNSPNPGGAPIPAPYDPYQNQGYAPLPNLYGQTQPVGITCPSCHAQVVTKVTYSISAMQWLMYVLLFLFFPLC